MTLTWQSGPAGAPYRTTSRRRVLGAGLWGTLGLAGGALGLAACGAAGSTDTAPAGSAGTGFDGTLLFGAPLSLTGSTAKEGGLTQEGYEIWKDTYNDAGGIK